MLRFVPTQKESLNTPQKIVGVSGTNSEERKKSIINKRVTERGGKRTLS